MNYGMALVVVVAVMVTALLNFASFLLSEDGEKAAKDRFADWYVIIVDGDWSTLVVSSAHLTEAFLNDVLGGAALSWRYLLLTSLLGTAFLSWYGSVILRWNVVAMLAVNPWSVTFVVVLNTLLDVVALMTTRILLRKIAASRGRAALSQTILVFALAYVLVGVATTLRTLELEAVQREVARFDYGAIHLTSAELVLLMPIAYPFFALEGSTMPVIHLGTFLPASFSALLLLVILLSSWLISFAKPIIQKPFALLVMRLAEAPKGSIAALANAMLAITGVLTAIKQLGAP